MSAAAFTLTVFIILFLATVGLVFALIRSIRHMAGIDKETEE